MVESYIPFADRRETNIDNIGADRGPLAGALDIYLPSIANRNAEAARTLTVLGNAALPGLVITSIFEMNN